MPGVLMRTGDTDMQREAHVRTQEVDSGLQPVREASGEASLADALISTSRL